MGEFFGFLKVAMGCGTLFFVVMLVLLALPQSRLRCVGLEMAKWFLAGMLLLLMPSPVDVIPDVVPVVGWLDDIGYLLGAIAAVRSALSEREKRKLYDEIELSELQTRSSAADLTAAAEEADVVITPYGVGLSKDSPRNPRGQ